MIAKHIETLNKTGLALLEKAANMNKVSEIEKCISLGSKLLADAREILLENKQNSILIFVEFALNLKIKITYKDYCEFCARNNMDMFSEADYLAYVGAILITE